MNRAAEVAASVVAKMFPKPRSEQVERHLSREMIEEIVRTAYDIGFVDGQKHAHEKKG